MKTRENSFEDGMRVKHELKHVEAPHTLSISNSAIQELSDASLDKSGNTISPETLSHRLHQGWQHLQELPENLLNNNLNYNNNPDDITAATLPTAPFFVDGDFQSMSSSDESDDSGSSSDEDSSVSFGDTSPLLDVSSLDSSDVSLDSDMSEDGSSPLENNNNNSEDNRSMENSWMSFSSTASSPSMSRRSVADASRGGSLQRNHVILPDVLPVGNVPRDDDDPMSDSSVSGEPEYTSANRELKLEATNRELKLDTANRELKLEAANRVSRDCCIVEITTQPDIQVDIRLNSASNRPFSDAYVKHGSTYPRGISKNFNHCLKTKDVNTWTAEDKYNGFDASSNKTSPRYWALGEGVRLNNFTIVNGFKALSLTELVKSNGITHHSDQGTEEKLRLSNCIPIENSRCQMDERQLSIHRMLEKSNCPKSGSIHLYCKENRRHPKDSVVLKQNTSLDDANIRPAIPMHQDKNYSASNLRSQKQHSRSVQTQAHSKNIEQRVSCRAANQDDNSNQFPLPLNASRTAKGTGNNDTSSRTKASDNKLSSPELFEVYNMETTVPHINWAAVSRASKESEWIRKRRNDREEIRKKLAMDSDTEDYVSEKLIQNRENSSVDRIKGGSNLQICFMNEAIKDQDVSKEDSAVKRALEKTWEPSLRIQNTVLQNSANIKCDMSSSRVQNNNNSHPAVTKRQRPTFFFNRPRSWHVTKPEERINPEEDLFTHHRRLQAEAREALAQAKDMARMQMEIERQKKKKSPIADIVGISFPDGRNLLSRHALLDMNVAQLQVIVNDLHSQIETLNEDLVKLLLERDDLHMEQDSMLVDIEDFTRYLGLKGSSCVTHASNSQLSVNPNSATNKKILKTEPVRRSQSVHLKKPKNLM